MFKNRAFQVKVVNADTSENSDVPAMEPIDPQKIINAVGLNVAMLIGVYVASDTVRQIAVHAAKNTIQ